MYLTVKVDVNEINKFKYFNSDIFILKSTRSLQEIIISIIDKFNIWIDNLYNIDFKGVIKIDIKTVNTKNIYEASYVDLPYFIKCKKACINIKNIESTKKGVVKYDNKCFLWCILSYFHYNDVKKIQCGYYKQFLNTIKQPIDINYPICIDDTHLYEGLNDFKINVFELNNDETKLKLIYDSYNNNEILINLLSYRNHYIFIKDIHRFEFSSTKNKNKYYRCMHRNNRKYNTLEKLEEHIGRCIKGIDDITEVMPQKGEISQFNNFHHQYNHPYYIVADFECTLFKIDGNNNSKTQLYERHQINSYGIKYNFSEPITIYNNNNPELVIENFILEIERLAKKSYDLSKIERDIIISKKEKENYNRNKNCLICKCEYTNKNNKKIQYQKISGKYILLL